MTKEQLKERTKQRRKESRDAAAWLYEIISDNLGQLHNNRSLKPSAMRIVDLQGFRILYRRLSKMAPHVNYYFHTKLATARSQRYEALHPKVQPDVYQQLAKLGLTISFGRNGTKSKAETVECAHGSYMYSAGLLYCSKCGVPATKLNGKLPVVLAPLPEPEYEVVQCCGYILQ